MRVSLTRLRSLALAAASVAGIAPTALAATNGGAYGRWVELEPNRIELHADGFDATGEQRFHFDLVADAATVGKSRVRGAATLVPYPGQPLLTRTVHVIGILDRRADGSAMLRGALAIDGKNGLELYGSILGKLVPLAPASVAGAAADTAPIEPDADVVDATDRPGSFVPRRGEFRARWKIS